jgi:hypothetical protein
MNKKEVSNGSVYEKKQRKKKELRGELEKPIA